MKSMSIIHELHGFARKRTLKIIRVNSRNSWTNNNPPQSPKKSGLFPLPNALREGNAAGKGWVIPGAGKQDISLH